VVSFVRGLKDPSYVMCVKSVDGAKTTRGFKKNTLLDLTDVCPLLTKQYIHVGLQIQYILYNF
jgi:hypothetical protein